MKQILLFFAALIFASCSFSAMQIPSFEGEPLEQKNLVHNTKEWTVMVYMAADNNLSSAAFADFNEIEASEYDREKMNVLTLIDVGLECNVQDTWRGARLYEMGSDKDGINKTLCSKELNCETLGLKKGSETELDMAKKETLENFLLFSREFYPAKKYALVIWGHGTGYRFYKENSPLAQSRAVAIDDTSDSFMETPTLCKAIEAGMEKSMLDLLTFDTCFASELEEVYEMQSVTKWFSGSEGTQSIQGLDYTKWLDSSACDCESGFDLAKKIEKQYLESERNDFAIVNMLRVGAVFSAFDAFALRAAKMILSESEAKDIRTSLLYNVRNFSASDTVQSPVYINIFSLVNFLAAKNTALSEVGKTVIHALEYAIPVEPLGNNDYIPLGVYLCSRNVGGGVVEDFSTSYIRGGGAQNQCAFVKESCGYVPTKDKSGSLLDKLFGNFAF